MNKSNVLLPVAILTGTFLVPVNSTMIAVGLPVIADTFDRSLLEVSWLVTIYLIAMAVLQPIAGKIGDLFGHRNVFLLGLAIFLFSSILCAFSFNLLSLIVFRLLQALGGALATPNATAVLRYAVPEQQLGKTLGFFGFSMGLGAAVGPLAGSFLIDTWGWTSMFWFNVPWALLSLAMSIALLPKRTAEKTKRAVDIRGSAYLAVFFTSLILFITRSEYRNVWIFTLFSCFLLLFVRRERIFREPLIDFNLFRDRTFFSANLSILLSNLVMYSTVLAIPILLQKGMHFDIKTVGGVLFVFSLSMSLFSWCGGVLAERLGRRKIIFVSFFVSSVAMILYIGFSFIHSLLYIVLVLLVGGLGAGIGLSSMQTASLVTVPKARSGIASGIFSTFRYMGGMSASVLVSLLVLNSSLFIVLLFVSASGLLVSFGIEQSRPTVKPSSSGIGQ